MTAALRDAIRDGEFSLGEALSEAGLSGRLGVSRTPVRAAFERTAEEFREICGCRTALETSALRLATARNRAALAARLAAVVSGCARRARPGGPHPSPPRHGVSPGAVRPVRQPLSRRRA